MSWNLTRNIEILVDAPMVAERLTPSDFDELYRKDMEGGYRPDVRHHRPDCLCFRRACRWSNRRVGYEFFK
jgi:hypothetical protein